MFIIPGIILHSLYKNDCCCHASDKRVQDRMTIATVKAIISSIGLLLALNPSDYHVQPYRIYLG
ncbi:hypothetical protein [Chlamydia abortus]|uniref:hypothetical protein n=1 Tax=Chlamydia abortus TaxID=83555 RepID=UPI0015588683|nr:hypothetical protein [Chlamydia abortus]